MNRRFQAVLTAPALAGLIAAGALVGTSTTATAGTTGPAQNYLVLYNSGASSSGAAGAIAAAGRRKPPPSSSRVARRVVDDPHG